MLESQVQDAFDLLISEGVEPSVRKVRDRIGHGSHTDINGILSRLKAEKALLALPEFAFPESLVEKRDRFTAQLWSSMKTEADGLIERVRLECAASVETVTSELAAALATADTLQADLDSASANIGRLGAALEARISEADLSGKEIAALRQREADLMEQIDGLRRLLSKSVSARKEEPSVQVEAASALAAKIERIAIKTIEDLGPIDPEDLDRRLSAAGSVHGRRLRRLVELAVSRGTLIVRPDGKIDRPDKAA